jgi:hypothetical protein
MKTSYELAMERLDKTSPIAKLNDKQKKDIAELESKYAAKVAERELTLKDEITKAAGRGEYEETEKLEQQLVNERKNLLAELEEKKDRVRAGK